MQDYVTKLRREREERELLWDVVAVLATVAVVGALFALVLLWRV